MKHLWEYEHPYYCETGNFYKTGLHSTFESWDAFAQPSKGFEGNALYDFDNDLNYLWRWDWNRAIPSDYEYELEEDPDFEIPGDRLLLFYMLQRKSYNISAEVAVTEEDEPAVREWLAKKANHMRITWEPLLNPDDVLVTQRFDMLVDALEEAHAAGEITDAFEVITSMRAAVEILKKEGM